MVIFRHGKRVLLLLVHVLYYVTAFNVPGQHKYLARTCLRPFILLPGSLDRFKQKSLLELAVAKDPLSEVKETDEFPRTQLTREEFLALQNGSDVRGVSVKHNRPVTLTPREARALGRGYARWLQARRLREWGPARAGEAGALEMVVAVGRDPRITSKALSLAFCQGLMAEGCAAWELGLATTPACYKTLVPPPGHPAADAAAMVTASHLPFDRNGMKFFDQEGGLSSTKMGEVLNLAAEIYEQDQDEDLDFRQFQPKPVEFMPIYQSTLAEKIVRDLQQQGEEEEEGGEEGGRPLAGLRLVVNAGNGAGGFFAGLLAGLGADVRGSLHLEPDGRFPNHVPNPEDKQAMAATVAAVRAAGADLGIVLDTDVDRAGVVMADGTELNRDRLVALMAAIVLENEPGATIVTDSVTSVGLGEFIAAKGGHHLRYQRGYRNVIEKAQALEAAGVKAPMAMETSGHCALRENGFLDDGAYLVVKVLVELVRRRRAGGGGLADTLGGLRAPAEEGEFRCAVCAAHEGEAAALAELAAARLAAAAAPGRGVPGWAPEEENHEGFRARVAGEGPGGDGAGYVMVRRSLHEPKIIFNCESGVPGGVARIVQVLLREVLTGELEEKTDISVLQRHLDQASQQE